VASLGVRCPGEGGEADRGVARSTPGVDFMNLRFRPTMFSDKLFQPWFMGIRN
jgi:hypothetical protein